MTRKFKISKKYSSLQGGRALGAGGFGCVFRPNLTCKKSITNFYKDHKYKKGISKLLWKTEANKEMKLIKVVQPIINQITNNYDYFIPNSEEPFYQCDVGTLSKEVDKFDMYKCSNLNIQNGKKVPFRNDEIAFKMINKFKDKFSIIQQADGGIDFNKYLLTKLNYTDTNILKTINLKLINLIKNGVIPMNKLGLLHLDIKPDNMVCNIDEKSKKPKSIRIIDWGFAAKMPPALTPNEIQETIINEKNIKYLKLKDSVFDKYIQLFENRNNWGIKNGFNFNLPFSSYIFGPYLISSLANIIELDEDNWKKSGLELLEDVVINGETKQKINFDILINIFFNNYKQFSSHHRIILDFLNLIKDKDDIKKAEESVWFKKFPKSADINPGDKKGILLQKYWCDFIKEIFDKFNQREYLPFDLDFFQILYFDEIYRHNADIFGVLITYMEMCLNSKKNSQETSNHNHFPREIYLSLKIFCKEYLFSKKFATQRYNIDVIQKKLYDIFGNTEEEIDASQEAKILIKKSPYSPHIGESLVRSILSEEIRPERNTPVSNLKKFVRDEGQGLGEFGPLQKEEIDRFYRETERDILKGGKALGAGSYGCVFNPMLDCADEKINPDSKGRISKLFIKPEGTNEKNLLDKVLPFISQIKNNQEYFIPNSNEAFKLVLCKPGQLKDEDDKEDLIKCSNLRKLNRDERFDNEKVAELINKPRPDYELEILQEENGGEDFKEFIDSMPSNNFLLSALNEKILRLIQNGIMPLNNLGIIHCDIKPENMVIKPTLSEYMKGRANFNNFTIRVIDWGLSVIYKPLLPSRFGEIRKEMITHVFQFNLLLSNVLFNSESLLAINQNYIPPIPGNKQQNIQSIDKLNKLCHAIYSYNKSKSKHFPLIKETINKLFNKSEGDETKVKEVITNFLKRIIFKYIKYRGEAERYLFNYFKEVYIHNVDIFGTLMYYVNLILNNQLNEPQLSKLKIVCIKYLYSAQIATKTISYHHLSKDLNKIFGNSKITSQRQKKIRKISSVPKSSSSKRKMKRTIKSAPF